MKSDNITSKEAKLKTASQHGIQAPLALLAELSHRCPLQCPYCSNPVQLEKKTGERGIYKTNQDILDYINLHAKTRYNLTNIKMYNFSILFTTCCTKRISCYRQYMAVCRLFGPRMTAERTFFVTAESFGLWGPQLWSQEWLEPFGELLGSSGTYIGSPRNPPHGNP